MPGLELNDLKTDNTVYNDIAGCNWIPHKMAKELDLPYKFSESPTMWISYNDDYYYVKSKEPFFIISELVGYYLSKYMSLDTVQHEIAMRNGEFVGLMSKNFRQEGIDYRDAFFASDKFKYANTLTLYKPPIILTEYAQVLARYLIRDYYACQEDRGGNVLYYIKNFKKHLAPLFDYEASFDLPLHDEYYYRNPLFSIDIGPNEISRIYKKNKYLREYYELIREFNMESTLDEIKQDYGINIPDSISYEFIHFDKTRKPQLEKIFYKTK